jgi:Protein of unknown function (DUF4239)
MNLGVSILVIVASAGAAVSALLVVRRNAPDGSYFHDGDRAAGVFGVLATGFAILLGFVVFLAFTSYDSSKNGAETEALTVAQQFETAQFFPAGIRRRLGEELVCYGRSVAYLEWPRMEAGTEGDAINPWGTALFKTVRTADPRTAAEQAAYGKWLDQTSDRETARNSRIHGADGVIPAPLWLVLIMIAVLILVFMLFFADSGERAVVQAMLIGTVIAVFAATLLVVEFLNNPFDRGVGSLRPVAMQRTLRILEEERLVVNETRPLPCDAAGRSLSVR